MFFDICFWLQPDFVGTALCLSKSTRYRLWLWHHECTCAITYDCNSLSRTYYSFFLFHFILYDLMFSPQCTLRITDDLISCFYIFRTTERLRSQLILSNYFGYKKFRIPSVPCVCVCIACVLMCRFHQTWMPLDIETVLL